MTSLIRDRRVKLETSILNEFLVLEETNSFSKAAKQLRISQASLSRHIKQLEDEYGVPLFERTTQKMKLTSYGQSLKDFATIMLEAERSFKREIEKINFKNSNHLVIGCVDFPFYYGITGVLADFKKEHPNATLEVVIHSTDELVKDLNQGNVDVAFIRNFDTLIDQFDSVFYKEDYLYIAVPAEHPLAYKEKASLDEFQNDTFYNRYAKGSYMNKLLGSLTTESGFAPKISVSSSNWEDSVINDINSITICNGGLANTFRGNMHIKVLELTPRQEVSLYLVTPKNPNRPMIVQQVIDSIK